MGNELTPFEKKHMMAFAELRNLDRDIKEKKKRIEEIKAILKKGMEEYGIKSINNEYVTITFVPENFGKLVIDETTYKANDPEGYHKALELYNKVSGAKKAYVSIKTK